MNNNQLQGTLSSMKSLISQLRQQEYANAEMAQELSAVENQNQNMLANSGNPQLQNMANKEGQAASMMNQLNNLESNAGQKLSQLEQMVNELENSLS